MNAKCVAMFLLPLDEMIIGSKFLQHVRYWHGATVSFIAKMNELSIRIAIGKAECEQCVRFNRNILHAILLFPHIFITRTDASGFNFRKSGLSPSQLSTLTPCREANLAC